MKAIPRRFVVAVAAAALLSTAAPAAHTVAAPVASNATAAAPAPGVLVLGAGSRPNLAVNAAGTGFVAWVGPEASETSLQFCRLPRGAGACASRHDITVPADTTSGHRPFVTVSGSTVRILQYRYPLAGPNLAGLYKFISTDSGATFGPGLRVGTVPFEDAVQGPGDTFSGVPINGEMAFQNVPLGSGSTVDKAVLSTTHQNHASVGLLTATTPLAVFTDNNAAQWRRYDGSGNLNSIANWTPTANVGVATYPRLAGGPTGLFLLAGNGSTGLNVRKFTGSGFGAPVSIGPGLSPSKHITQDAAGRLHAVFQRDDANPLRLIHAVSDDGVNWRSGILVTQNLGTDGGIQDLRVAAAPDHLGFTVWHAGLGAGDVRITSIGPDAPAGTVRFGASPDKPARVLGGQVRLPLRRHRSGQRRDQPQEHKKVRVGDTLQFLTVPASATPRTGKAGSP